MPPRCFAFHPFNSVLNDKKYTADEIEKELQVQIYGPEAPIHAFELEDLGKYG